MHLPIQGMRRYNLSARGDCSPPQKKRKQISKLVRFIMNTARISNVIVTDFKFTSFSSGQESSPHNTSPLEAERLYLSKLSVYMYNMYRRLPCTMYTRSRFSGGHIPVFSRSCATPHAHNSSTRTLECNYSTGFMAVDRWEPVCQWRCSLDRSRMSRLMIPRGGIKIILHVYKVQGRARHLEGP